MTIKKLPVERVSFEHFSKLPDYVHQRDTQSRLNKPHLKGEMIGDLLNVAAVALSYAPENMCKIDGHSRVAAVAVGQMKAPEFFDMTVFVCDTMEEMNYIYKQFCSTATSETAKEEAEHARSVANLKPKTTLGKSSWKSAMKHAGAVDVRSGTLRFATQLAFVDTLDVNKDVGSNWPVGIRSALLETFETDEAFARKFWKAYSIGTDNSIKEAAELRTLLAADKAIATGAGGQTVSRHSTMARAAVREYIKRMKGE